MDVKVQYILNNNNILKRYLREHSFYYKNILRNPNFINDLVKLMRKVQTIDSEVEYNLNSAEKKLKNVKVIANDYITIDNEHLRHDAILLSLDIFKYLIKK